MPPEALNLGSSYRISVPRWPSRPSSASHTKSRDKVSGRFVSVSVTLRFLEVLTVSSSSAYPNLLLLLLVLLLLFLSRLCLRGAEGERGGQPGRRQPGAQRLGGQEDRQVRLSRPHPGNQDPSRDHRGGDSPPTPKML